MRNLILAAAFSLLFLQCSQPAEIAGGSTTTTDNAKVSGCVFTAGGLPAQGAAVRLRERNYVRPPGSGTGTLPQRDTVTDDSGQFLFDSLKKGAYRIEVNDLKAEALLLSCTIDNDGDSVALPGDTLRPYTAIAGKIDSSQFGEAPLFVQIEGMDRLASIDSAGSFVIADLPPGDYTVRIVSPDTAVAPKIIDSVVTDTGVTVVEVDSNSTARIGRSTTVGPWVEVQGPFFSKVTGIVADPGNTVFIGTKNRSVFLSTDNGAQWEKWYDSDFGLQINRLMESFENNGTRHVFIATPTGIFTINFSPYDNRPGIAGRVVRNAGIVQAFAASNDTALLFVKSEFEPLSRSTDAGTSWTFISSGNGFTDTSVYCLAISPNAGGGVTVYAGTSSGGVMHSSDSGLTWTRRTNGLMNAPTQCLAASRDGKKIFAGNSHGVFASTDEGANWTQLLAQSSATDIIPSVSIAVSAATVLVSFHSAGIFLSRNDGAEWSRINDGLMDLSVNNVAIGATKLFAGSDHYGVFSCDTSGATWTGMNAGRIKTGVYHLTSTGRCLFAFVEGAGIFRSGGTGTNWTRVNNGLPYKENPGSLNGTWIDFLTAGPNLTGGSTLFASCDQVVYSSADEGENWTIVNSVPSGYYARAAAFIDSTLVLGYDDMNDGGGSGIMTSSDCGMSWNKFSSVPSPAVTILDGFHDSSGRLTVFALSPTDGLFMSCDNGVTWTSANNNLETGSIYRICVNTYGANHPTLFAGMASGYVYRSTDDGAHWTVSFAGSPEKNQVADLFVQPGGTGGGAIFAGYSDRGILYSTNNGESWTLSNLVVEEGFRPHTLTVHENCIYAGTAEHGLWKAPLW